LQDRWATPFKVEDDQGTLEIMISEESAKLNLNSVVGATGAANEAPYGIWARLLKRLKLSPELGDVLADWIDTNDEPHPGGAETSWYRTQTPPVAARNGQLATVEELALLKGFDPGTRAKLVPYVTVYAGQSGEPITPININTAPLELLAVLDDTMTDDLARRIDERRKSEPFAQAADLAKVPGLETIATKVALRVGVKGSVFRVVARGTVGATSRVVEAVARINNGATTILYWREY
jgi:general secretion pathway protein K